MSSVTFNDGKIVKDYGNPYVIAELNSSHNGNLDIARQMIDVARNAGCDCVKFQSWSTQSLYSKTYYKENPIAKRFIDKFSLSPDKLKDLSKYCNEIGIGFSSTPYSMDEVDFLVDECNVPFIKVSSMEVNNLEFLKYIGNKQVPIVLSTGMAEMGEIKKAIAALEETKNHNIVLLHCVSLYPAEAQTINLNNIFGLREIFSEYPIGFSDHTLGDAAAVAAVALGAAVIEKHITMDASKIGMDNQMAMEPQEFAIMVSKCRAINVALGKKERVVLPAEFEQRSKMRRSIVVTRDMMVGDVIKREDLDVKRPGDGIPPSAISQLVGRTVIRAIESDTLIEETDYDGSSIEL